MAFDSKFDLVALLVPGNGANNATTITDIKGHVLTSVNGAKTSSDHIQFGQNALFFDGVDDVITSPNAANLAVNNVDFCIEFWIWLPTGSAGGLVCRYGKATGWLNYAVKIQSSGQVNIALGATGGSNTSWNQTNPAGIPRDQWVFVKASLTGTQVQCWVGGASYYLASTSPVVPGAASALTMWMGRTPEVSLPLNAYIQDFRLTIGDSRPETNTTVPTEPFPLSGLPVMVGSTGRVNTPSSLMGKHHSIAGNVIHNNVPSSLMSYTTLSIHDIVGNTNQINIPNSLIGVDRGITGNTGRVNTPSSVMEFLDWVEVAIVGATTQTNNPSSTFGYEIAPVQVRRAIDVNYAMLTNIEKEIAITYTITNKSVIDTTNRLFWGYEDNTQVQLTKATKVILPY